MKTVVMMTRTMGTMTVMMVMFQTQQEGLTKWLDEMDMFLHADDPAVGDIPALQAQLQESQVCDEPHCPQLWHALLCCRDCLCLPCTSFIGVQLQGDK